MKALSPVIATTLLLLIVIFSFAGTMVYFNRIQNRVETAGESSIIYPEKPPKVSILSCYPGYARVSLIDTGSSGINGTIYFFVKNEETGEIKKGNRTVAISSAGDVYLPVKGDPGDVISIKVYTPYWQSTDSCVVHRDSHLVLWFKFDEGSGTTAEDSSRHDNDGTIHGGNWTSGKSGYALQLNGSGEYVSVDDSSSLEPEKITISAWIKPYTTGNWQIILRKDESSGTPDQGYSLAIGNDFSFFRFEVVTSNGLSTLDAGTPTQGEWQHVAAVYNGSAMNLYVNGELEGSEVTNGSITYSGSNALWISRHASGYYLNGTLDDVRVYSRALDGQAVEAIYEAYRD